MNHLTPTQIAELAIGKSLADAQAHLDACAVCRARVARAAKFERALHVVPRVPPSAELEARVKAALVEKVPTRVPTSRLLWVSFATFLAALFVLASGYQTAVEIQAGGALDFISVYARQPGLLAMYPGESLGALVEALPLVQILVTLGLVVIAAVLTMESWNVISSSPRITMQNGSRGALR